MYRIAIYSHYKGYGHSSYANQIASYNKDCFSILTSSDYNFNSGINVIHLPDEELTGGEIRNLNVASTDVLHYNPQGNYNILLRSSIILDSLITKSIDLLLVDVSVEIAMLARVASIPYAYRRMPGLRTDTAHVTAYQGAQFLYAFYPEVFESSETASWIKEKTIYLGFLSESKFPKREPSAVIKKPKLILVIQGQGGNSFTRDSLNELETQFPSSMINVIGSYQDAINTDRSTYHGFVSNPEMFIEQSDLVIAGCGSSTVSMLIAMNVIFLALPEDRPYNEQYEIATQLERHQLAAVVRDSNYLQALENIQKFEPQDRAMIQPKTAKDFSQLLIRHGYDSLHKTPTNTQEK